MASVNYGQIISRSKNLVFKHKWLWVYGLVLAAFEGGGFNSFSNFSSNSKDKLKDLPGAATHFLSDWLAHVPVTTWIFLILGITALVLMGLILGLVIRSWAKGSLIAGVALASKDKPVTLLNTSPQGLASIKSLILFGTLSLAIVLGVLLAIFVVGALMFIINPILGGVYSFVAVLAILVMFALLATMGVYADRLIVFEGYTPMKAFKTGLGYGWHEFFPTLVMGLVNSSLGCATGCLANLVLLLVLGLPAVFLAWPLFQNPSQTPGPLSWLALVILIILFFTANFLIRALLVVFNYSNWNQFYEQIVKAKHD